MGYILGIIIVAFFVYCFVIAPSKQRKIRKDISRKMYELSPTQQAIVELQKDEYSKKITGYDESKYEQNHLLIRLIGDKFSVDLTTNGLVIPKGEHANDCAPVSTTDLRYAPCNFQAVSAQTTVTTTQNKSVAKSAIAGGILAGGAGAVVGAVRAADINARGGVSQVRKADTDCFVLTAYGEKINRVVIWEQAIDALGIPEYIENFRNAASLKFIHDEKRREEIKAERYKSSHSIVYWFETDHPSIWNASEFLACDEAEQLIDYMEEALALFTENE